MQEPQLYHTSHETFKAVTGQFIEKYLAKFQWRNDGADILMDVGTGPGDVFMENIRPAMPKQFEKAICVDLLPEMIDFSQRHYKNPEKCEYRVLDIKTRDGLPKDLKGKIHHLTAIHVMHWIEDFGKGQALGNIYELLHPEGGDCLIIFMPHAMFFDVYVTIQKSLKWHQYFRSVDEYIPKSNYSKNFVDEFLLALKDAGFSQIAIEESRAIQHYEDYESFKAGFTPVCALLKYIPKSKQSEFLDDCIAEMEDMFYRDVDAKPMDSKYGVNFNLIVAHAKKLPNLE